MAGRFEGLSDLEWQLFADILPPPPMQRGRGMPPTPWRRVVTTLLYVLITGCRWCDIPRGAPLGLEECCASLAEALAAGWDPDCDAGTAAGHCRGAGHDSVAVWGR